MAWVADRDFGNSFALEVSQVLFAGGAILQNIKASQLQADMACLDVQAERQKVRFLLTGYYLDLYKYRNQLTVYEKNIAQTRQVIADMKAREAAGIALDNDITRYEAQLQSLLYKRTELTSAISICNSQL
ncbi:MAG: TolC family protein [Bacteroides sp.]|nr:TolC family protein [Bacteroides sp.]